ncbi:DUF2202 domain-containing protein [Burkholderiaceae bacterium FT117]|uniref:DUF2202 domain-containing protein n=1 Tax=Zeimonas sediminis TaxID=2944268 RepID=UPI002342C2FB|nr:DUF2202 domain-containing protein [Zeimonas sediminis]MCM5570119.1 DUF2202 domain-containing protein [Zeimonas sediminis]
MDRKHFIRGMSAMLGAVVFGPVLTACGSGGDDSLNTIAEAGVTGDTTLTSTGLDEIEIAGLKFMREEEKLAHDVYATLFNTWGAEIFSNIAASETAHTEAVLGQIELYGIEDPAEGNPVGVFEDPYLQALYDKLIAMGSVSLIEGLKVGALIEETDIVDIREKMEDTDEASILQVYQNLLCGSYEHLQAFDKALRANGVSYQSQVITQEEWDAIVAGTASCTA